MRHRNSRHERRAKEAQYRKERKKAHKETLRAIPRYPTSTKAPTKVQMQRRDLQQRFDDVSEEKRQLEKKLAQVNRELAEALKKIQSMQLTQGAMQRAPMLGRIAINVESPKPYTTKEEFEKGLSVTW